jgi:excisionase family DNA binding protein
MTTHATNCAHCGRPIDVQNDAWRLLPGHRYEHLACPISAEMQSLPPVSPPGTLSQTFGRGQGEGHGPGPLPRFISMDEAAEFLRVSKSTIRAKIRAGELPAKRLKGGHTVLIEIRDVLALLEPYTGNE